jgi:hypothetical protein
MQTYLDQLTKPSRIYNRTECLERNGPIPKDSGVYAWYFKETPPRVPLDNCVVHAGLHLLYIGISPSKPPRQSKPSSQNLSKRIKYHYRGNAEGSTLRLTLGCLLSETLGIELRRVGNGKRMTFHNGENKISQWMSDNAFATWAVHPEPWRIEEYAVKQISLPLNLRKNEHHPFHRILTSIRRQARRKARASPIIN